MPGPDMHDADTSDYLLFPISERSSAQKQRAIKRHPHVELLLAYVTAAPCPVLTCRVILLPATRRNKLA